MNWTDAVFTFGPLLIFGFIWLVALYYVSHDYSLWELLKKIFRREDL